jgi:hypothetical protein
VIGCNKLACGFGGLRGPGVGGGAQVAFRVGWGSDRSISNRIYSLHIAFYSVFLFFLKKVFILAPP